jgi:hypothetical protein
MKIQKHDVEVLYIALAGVMDTSRNRDKERWGMPNSKPSARFCLERAARAEFVVAGNWVQGLARAVLG